MVDIPLLDIPGCYYLKASFERDNGNVGYETEIFCYHDKYFTVKIRNMVLNEHSIRTKLDTIPEVSTYIREFGKVGHDPMAQYLLLDLGTPEMQNPVPASAKILGSFETSSDATQRAKELFVSGNIPMSEILLVVSVSGKVSMEPILLTTLSNKR